MNSARSSSDSLVHSYDGLLREKKVQPRTLLSGYSLRTTIFYALASFICATILVQCILMIEMLRLRGQSPIRSGDDINRIVPQCALQFGAYLTIKTNLLILLLYSIYAGYTHKQWDGSIYFKLHFWWRHGNSAASMDRITSSYVFSVYIIKL